MADAIVDIVTDAVGIGVCSAVAAAHAQGVELVAAAVTVAGRNVRASAFVHGARPVADAAVIEFANAVVDVVANAVRIRIGGAGSTAHAESVGLVAVTVAVAGRNVGAATFINLARTVAHAAGIQRADAIVDVVADAVAVCVSGTIAAAHAEGVGLVAVAVTVSCWNVGTTAFIDGPGTVADAAVIEGTDARIDVVADAVCIGVGGTVTTTHAQGVQLVAVAVAVTFWDSGAAALVNRAGTAANAAGIQRLAGAVVVRSVGVVVAGRFVGTARYFVVVAHAISVDVGGAGSAAHAEGIQLVAVAVTISGRDVGTPAVVNRAGAIAHPTVVHLPNAAVDVVADPI